MFGCDIGIDLGTASVLVYVRGRGIVLQEPSVVAVINSTGEVLEVGAAAQRMLGRTPGSISAIRPLKEGVISNFDITEKLLQYFIRKVVGKGIFSRKPRIAICVPCRVTEVERRAVEDAAREAGARQVYVIEEPIAAAIGAGIDITAARGSMVVDVGGGTTDAAVIALGGFVTSVSIKTGGDHMDDAIINYVRKKYNLLIGERTAESVKISIGTAYPALIKESIEIRGRSLSSGLPENRIITSDEIAGALSEPISAIMRAVRNVLETTPPELVADIADRGIVLTGGGCLLHGLDVLMAEQMGIDVVVADDAVTCVASGTGKYVEHIARYNANDFLAGKTGRELEF
ncbi:MAG: rod shape-determining protein [Defluviitaleaceae bacterium]|nr:rod shape-determining protein [Defluviitaleaceae bacterium]MCL2835500.1 rod shape-determining protein [Defluviitaleaceae bacterium]